MNVKLEEKMSKYNWADWTEWIQLEGLDYIKVPSRPGAYIIATDRPINRAFDLIH
jgi:hypothetical protein